LELINTVIGVPLGALMRFCWLLLDSYGPALILFTLLTRLILFPVNIWLQKNSIRMVRLQPQLNGILARFAGSRGQAGREQVALYKREGYRPLAGLLPLLIQLPLILGLISVIYNPLQHLLRVDAGTIDHFTGIANQIAGRDLGGEAQLKIIEYIQSGEHLLRFSSRAPDVVLQIRNLDLHFLGFDLAHAPSLAVLDVYLLVPLMSALSALLLAVCQNHANVLQREQGFFNRWGMALFLTVFSGYFALIVPVGIGIYWVLGNLFAVATLYLLNLIWNPKKYIDYPALEESKRILAIAKEAEQAARPTKEMRARAKIDSKRFFAPGLKKQLVYYSEKSGFYKYFAAQIAAVTDGNDVMVHYITSDPNDQIFTLELPRVEKYYINENRLIPLFMKMDADVVVMTAQSLQTYHIKRSLVRKDVEYIYTPHDPLSVHMGTVKGAFDHFDTVFCVGPHQLRELREQERVYDLKPKNLVECGYALIDDLIAAYEALPKTDYAGGVKKILIGPSWQEGNLLEGPVEPLLDSLLGKGYDITLRPHPEYVKRYPARIRTLSDRYAPYIGEDFRIETDFASNVTIFTADLVITDWSGIAPEFSYATGKPCLFINTPKKVMNPEYEKISCEPLEVRFRNKIGIALEEADCGRADRAVAELLAGGEKYREQIAAVVAESLYNPGHSTEIAAAYILDAIAKKQKNKKLY